MTIPKTTKEKPYIEFAFSKKGKLKLTATSNWWGGINSGFYRTGGYEGNTCEPKNLDRYIIAFKRNKLKNLDKEIAELQLKRQNYLKLYNINK